MSKKAAYVVMRVLLGSEHMALYIAEIIIGQKSFIVSLGNHFNFLLGLYRKPITAT